MSGYLDLNREVLILLTNTQSVSTIIYKINHGKVLRNTRYVDQIAMANVKRAGHSCYDIYLCYVYNALINWHLSGILVFATTKKKLLRPSFN